MNKVLVVDDNEQNREACQIALEDCFDLMFAVNGKEGLLKTKQFDPDVILLDIMMPVMDGCGMLRQLKNDSEFSEIPVLMLTADANVESIERCLGMGADDYVMKPFNVRTLKARVSSLARRGHLEKERSRDLCAGARIQRQFLTGEKSVVKIFERVGYEVTIFNQAPATISGDFFYPKKINDHSAGIFFADTCGHGIPAALISMRILSVIDHLRSPSRYPSEFLEVVNEDIKGLMPKGNFVAGAYIIIHRNSVRISNAGLPFPLILSNGMVQEVEVPGLPLGQGASSNYSNVEATLNPGDRLVLYTDGITEAANRENRLYGKIRFQECLKENVQRPLIKFKDAIIADLQEFTGEIPLDDDITLVVFENRDRVN